ncbi:MAG: nucleotide exchange factor GrpE [bacterium]
MTHHDEEKNHVHNGDIDPALEAKLGELAILKESVEDQKLKTNERDEKILRLQADFDNYRKRVEKEKGEFVKFSNEKIIEKILSLFDDLERAEKAAEESENLKTLKKGINLIYKNFSNFLKKEGVKEIESVGEILDPTKHHVAIQVDSEDHKENEIIEEFQKGYMFNGKVIRPALVKVAQNPEKESE